MILWLHAWLLWPLTVRFCRWWFCYCVDFQRQNACDPRVWRCGLVCRSLTFMSSFRWRLNKLRAEGYSGKSRNNEDDMPFMYSMWFHKQNWCELAHLSEEIYWIILKQDTEQQQSLSGNIMMLVVSRTKWLVAKCQIMLIRLTTTTCKVAKTQGCRNDLEMGRDTLKHRYSFYPKAGRVGWPQAF